MVPASRHPEGERTRRHNFDNLSGNAGIAGRVPRGDATGD
jgi:hypothetical protein